MKKIKLLILILLLVLNLKVFASDSPKITSEFAEVLGLLDEYMSRFHYMTGKPIDSLVESFYPHEKDLADNFIRLINTYEQDCQIHFGLEKSIGEQGHIYIYSDTLSKLINSLYEINQDNIATLDSNVILDEIEEFRFAYLKGVYNRFGGNNQIAIANGYYKLLTTQNVFRSLGITDIKLMRTTDDYISINHLLIFDCNNDIKQKLNFSDKKIVENLSIYVNTD